MVCVDHWSLLRYSDAGEPLKGSSCKGASNGRLQHLTCLFDSTAKGEEKEKEKEEEEEEEEEGNKAPTATSGIPGTPSS